MLRTWSFWKTFFISYAVLVAGIWGFVEASTYFAGDYLKQLFGSNWWVFYYLVPLFIAFALAMPRNTTEETRAETLDQRNRRVMLNHVEEFWVKGILEKSLHGAALLELGIKEDPGKVRYPWAIKREPTNETLPAGKSMLAIFEEAGLGRSLLILGAPGSGKTTMLLELARQLIERARLDETEPIPVVFNLASWKEKQTLADWLAEQLNILYYVPKKTAPAWVNENRMLLLLDGLDEVRADSRGKCVEAINQFRKEHGLTSLVVCSRIEEYSALNAKLLLEGAITLQPLTSRQINDYFERFGKGLAAVKGLLKKDKGLQELAETPLMLSIMALAYKDRKADELITSENPEQQRKHLFEAYITRMFERSTRTANISFSKEQTLRYLSWLARMMIKHNIITYQIEVMQPSWLEEETQSRLYRLYFGLMGGLLGALMGWLGGWLSGGLGIGLMLSAGPSVRLIVGLIVGLMLSAGPSVGLLFGLIIWLMLRPGVGLMLSGEEKIIMVDKLKWSWKEVRKGWSVGLSIGLMLSGGLIGGLIGWLSIGLLVGLITGLLSALNDGVIGEQIEETTYPGQRLKQTLFNAAFFGLIGGLLGALTLGLIGGLIGGLISWLMGGHIGWVLGGLIFGLSGGLIAGLSGGLIAGLFKAGNALLQHFALRFVLARYQLLPRRLIPFLDHAVALIFLRRVGGSYIFVHRLLMEHFAEMEV